MFFNFLKENKSNLIFKCQRAMVAIRKIEDTYKFKFKFGSASHELYEASGCSEDWGKEIAKINYTYVVELKPEKSDVPESGFELPESKIEGIGQEMFDGFIEYMKTFLTNKIDQSIINECKNKLSDMHKDLESGDYDSHPDFGPESN
jgi:hypothetical protein